METNQENHAVKIAMNWEHVRDQMNKQYLQAYDKAELEKKKRMQEAHEPF
jgi:hypothetical protein